MFSYEIMRNDGLVLLKAAGPFEIEDYQDFGPRFFADVKSQNVRRILLDWREFQGWNSEEAPTITFFSWLEGRPLFDRIAIVFHDGVRNEVDKFEEFFRNADKEVRRFRSDRYEAALGWLNADNGEMGLTDAAKSSAGRSTLLWRSNDAFSFFPEAGFRSHACWLPGRRCSRPLPLFRPNER